MNWLERVTLGRSWVTGLLCGVVGAGAARVIFFSNGVNELWALVVGVVLGLAMWVQQRRQNARQFPGLQRRKDKIEAFLAFREGRLLEDEAIRRSTIQIASDFAKYRKTADRFILPGKVYVVSFVVVFAVFLVSVLSGHFEDIRFLLVLMGLCLFNLWMIRMNTKNFARSEKVLDQARESSALD